MDTGYIIADEVQEAPLNFNGTTGTKVGPFARSGWYQLATTTRCYIRIVKEESAYLGVDAANVNSANGISLYDEIARAWYIPKGGYLGAIGYGGESGSIEIFRVRN